MASTVIGSSIVVDGEIAGDEDLVVRGSIKGKIHVQGKVEVESGANLEASIEAGAVVVAGSVAGDLSAAERVELCADSTVIGDIRSPRILIAEGASFKGSVDMEVQG
ncbi:MAG: polymer-forming cytoskeletal protein [Nannocystaceae bacterium]|nr:polymer-forming cytoskeletal protein [Myxococcales bacterium]